MRILVTGGFGYLGGRIAHRLEAKGQNIILGSTKENISPNWLPNAEVRKIDWNDNDSLDSTCQNVQIVIHTAGMNAKDCEKNPRKALQFNGNTTAKLVHSIIKANVRQFIYLSTKHVYKSSFIEKLQ